MTDKLVGVDPAEPIPVIDYRAFCDVWAQDESGLVVVSFLGAHTVVKSLWGHLTAGHTIELAGGTVLRRQNRCAYSDESNPEGEYAVRYARAVVRLAGINQTHLVMVAEPATVQAAPGQIGYLLASQDDGDPARFFALWNRVVALPARSAWATYLWAEGLRHGAITPIAAYGCYVWAINPLVEPWQDILRGGIEDGALT
jgi:hypothetical protein